jgi:hypothetical protein
MNSLTWNQKRLISAVVLAIALVGIANYYLDIGLFGRFGTELYVASVGLLVLFAFLFVGPWAEQRRKERGKP